jgi:monoterpene epsilon-lactone hydrolase
MGAETEPLKSPKRWVFSSLSLLNTGSGFFLDRWMIALIIGHTRLRNLLQMLVCPGLEHVYGFNQRLSQRRERIFDDWRHDGMDDALDQAIAFHRPQGLREHLGRNAVDTFEYLAEPHRAFFQRIDDQGCPLIGDQLERMPRQAVGPENIRVCLLLCYHTVILSLFGSFLQDSRLSTIVTTSERSSTHLRTYVYERGDFLMSSPESLQIRSYLLALKAAQGAPAPLAEQRASFEKLVENYVGHPLPLPEGTRIESVDVDGIPAAWISPAGADQERVVLYFHGGAYTLGSLTSHRELVARLSAAAGVRSLQIDYRLAPEHVFPAALDDALTTYRWLLAHGTKPEHIVLAGDSAGGGLSLALLQVVRDQHLPMPAGAVLLSPWTDLVGTVESRTTRDAVDPVFSGSAINFLANFYAGTEEKHNPLLSPIYADLHGFPPLLIEVGNDEVLLDDALHLAEHARAAHVSVELTVWEDMWHLFQLYASVLPEGQQSLENMGNFIRSQTRSS